MKIALIFAFVALANAQVLPTLGCLKTVCTGEFSRVAVCAENSKRVFSDDGCCVKCTTPVTPPKESECPKCEVKQCTASQTLVCDGLFKPAQQLKRQLDLKLPIGCPKCLSLCKCVDIQQPTCTCETRETCEKKGMNFVRNLFFDVPVVKPDVEVKPDIKPDVEIKPDIKLPGGEIKLPEIKPEVKLPGLGGRKRLSIACKCEGRCVAKCATCKVVKPVCAKDEVLEELPWSKFAAETEANAGKLRKRQSDLKADVDVATGVKLAPQAYFCYKRCPQYRCVKKDQRDCPDCPLIPQVIKCPPTHYFGDLSTFKVPEKQFAPSAPPQNVKRQEARLTIAAPVCKPCRRYGCIPRQTCQPCVVPGVPCPEGTTRPSVDIKPGQLKVDGFVGIGGKVLPATTTEKAADRKRQAEVKAEVEAERKTLIDLGAFPVIGCPKCITGCVSPPPPVVGICPPFINLKNCEAQKSCVAKGGRWLSSIARSADATSKNTKRQETKLGSVLVGVKVDSKPLISIKPACRGCARGVCLPPKPVCKCPKTECEDKKEFFVPKAEAEEKVEPETFLKLKTDLEAAKKAFDKVQTEIKAEAAAEAKAELRKRQDTTAAADFKGEIKLIKPDATLFAPPVTTCLCAAGACAPVKPPVFCKNTARCKWSEANKADCKGTFEKTDTSAEKALFAVTCGCPVCKRKTDFTVKVDTDTDLGQLAESLKQSLGGSLSVAVAKGNKEGEVKVTVEGQGKVVEEDEESEDFDEAKVKASVESNSLVESVVEGDEAVIDSMSADSASTMLTLSAMLVGVLAQM